MRGGLLAVAMVAACAAPQPREGRTPSSAPLQGSWNEDRRPHAKPVDSEAVLRLKSIGYLSGYRGAPDSSSVTRWDRDKAYAGLNLYTSGHAPEATLMAMDGTVIHRWSYAWDRAFPREAALPSTPAGREHWRRVRMLPDGGLLAIYEGQGLIRLDRDSRLMWALPIAAHHDLQVRADGRIFVLTRDVRSRDDIHNGDPILEDFVTEIAPDGRVIGSFSLIDAFLTSDYAACVWKAPSDGDIFHTNTLQLLDGKSSARLPAFRAGNLLISSPQLDTIAVVDPSSKRVVWAMSGLWHFQHEPVLLANGMILILDNQGRGDGRSRVLEIDPLTQRVVWSYEGDDAHPFFTRFNGSVQRLRNGDTLIVESDGGRAFEVDGGRRIVWEFVNPHRAGKNGELIASLFDLMRIDAPR